MFVPCCETSESWEQYTLIIPAVCVGNVGQLATDLIITGLAMTRVGSLYDDSLLPLVGNEPFYQKTGNTCNIVTTCEVYHSSEHKVIAIQQRAPFVRGKRAQFLEKLVAWIKEKKFQQVIILSGSFAHERRGPQFTGTQMRYLQTPDMAGQDGRPPVDQLGWVELEKRSQLLGAQERLYDQNTQSEVCISGGGIAKSCYNACKDNKVAATVLLKFCSEGDNTTDAVELATYLNDWKQWLDLQSLKKKHPKTGGFTPPSSWTLLFGNSYAQAIY